jgi:signal transduction histidine kinase
MQLSDIDSLSAFIGLPLVLLDMHGIILSSSKNIPHWLDYHDLGEPLTGRMLLFFDESGQSLTNAEHPLNRVLTTGEPIRETSFSISRDDTGPVMALVSLTSTLLDEHGQQGILLAIHPGEADRQTKETNPVTAELQNKLHEVKQTHERLLSLVHHDLKSPLAGLAGISEINLRNQGKASAQENLRLAELMHRTAEQAFQKFDKLLTWALTQTQAIKTLQKPLDLAQVILANIQILAFAADQKSVEITVDCPQDTWVFADETMLSSIIQNIATNAIKFTASGGKVTLTTELTARDVTVKIRDSGTGMSRETIKKLFHNHDKISSLGTAGEKGTGLGLILCKDFVERNGGQLSIQSELGNGSEVSFTLPLFGGIGLPNQTA